MGFKTFVADEVLTAADLQAFLMNQAVVVTTSGARPLAPVDGMTIVESDTKRCYFYDDDSSTWVRQSMALTAAGRTGCSVRRVAAQSVPALTRTAISWDTEDFDSDASISVPSSSVICRVAGLYVITAQAVNAAEFGDNQGDGGALVVDGVDYALGFTNGSLASKTGHDRAGATTVASLAVDDVVQLVVEAPNVENFTASLSMYRISA